MIFDKLESAAAAAQDALELKLAACDLMDRRILRLARDVDPRYAAAIPRDAEAMLIVEQQSSEQREVIESLQQVAPPLAAEAAAGLQPLGHSPGGVRPVRRLSARLAHAVSRRDRSVRCRLSKTSPFLRRRFPNSSSRCRRSFRRIRSLRPSSRMPATGNCTFGRF